MSLIERSRSGSVFLIAAFVGLQAAGAGPVGRNDEPPASNPNAKKGAQAPAPAPAGPKSQAPSPGRSSHRTAMPRCSFPRPPTPCACGSPRAP